jgi:hypothetical protein
MGHSLKRVVLIAGAALVVLAIGAVASAMFLLRGTGDVLTRMAPADSSVYATVYLDPALKQKMNIRGLLAKFPATRTSSNLQSTIAKEVDHLLSGTGLTYGSDVKSWLGTQIGVVVWMSGGSEKVAVLVASKDDGAAEAALAKFRKGPRGLEETWKEETHDGVTVSVGSRLGRVEDAFAYVGHAVVWGDDQALIDHIIDTSDGKAAALAGSAAYANALQPLPKERLGLVYVNAAALVARLKQSIASGGIDFTESPSGLSQLDAYRTFAMTVSAQPDGVAADIDVTVDPSKLTPEQQREAAMPPHENTVLAVAPQNTFALIAVTGFRQAAQNFLDQASASSPDFTSAADDLGLTGPKGVVAHLSGDMGLLVGPGKASPIPAGAWVIGTDDEDGMQGFLNRIGTLASENLSAFASPTGGGRQPLQWTREPYRGAVISSLSVPELRSLGVVPAYAVADGFAILASSPEEIKGILDAHAAGPTIASSANYTAALGGSAGPTSSVFYLDIEGIAGSVRANLPPEEQQRYDASVAPNLAPVKAYVQTMRSGVDHVTARVFVLIQ